MFLALLPAIDESDESELSEREEREKARVSKVECKPLVEASADLQVLLCNSVFNAASGSQVYRAATEQFDRFTARQRKDQTFLLSSTREQMYISGPLPTLRTCFSPKVCRI